MKRILFYEFSDITREPIPFHTIEDFNNFCKKYDLINSVSGNLNIQFDGLNINGTIKATCIKGTRIVTYWTYLDKPSEFTMNNAIKTLKMFLDEKFTPETTYFYDSGRMTRICCGNENKFYALIWGGIGRYDYLYLSTGSEYPTSQMNPCFTNECDIIKSLEFFKEEVRRGLCLEEKK